MEKKIAAMQIILWDDENDYRVISDIWEFNPDYMYTKDGRFRAYVQRIFDTCITRCTESRGKKSVTVEHVFEE